MALEKPGMDENLATRIKTADAVLAGFFTAEVLLKVSIARFTKSRTTVCLDYTILTLFFKTQKSFALGPKKFLREKGTAGRGFPKSRHLRLPPLFDCTTRTSALIRSQLG